MRIITVPAEITVKDKAFPFKEVLVMHLDNYVELKTVSQSRDAAKIIDKIEAANGTLSLEDAQYDILKAACAKVVYVPYITRHLLGYYDAVEGATKE